MEGERERERERERAREEGRIRKKDNKAIFQEMMIIKRQLSL